jgi:ketosteroid isomerase-like protein
MVYNRPTDDHLRKGPPMSENGDLVRRLFKAVEARDLEAVLACYDEDIEIHEAGALPYGGVYRGHEGAIQHAAGWLEAWGQLQTPDEYRLDATFLEGEGDTVGAVFRHRAVDSEHGERFDAPEVGIYQIRAGKIVRSQMFHADSADVLDFLERARQRA